MACDSDLAAARDHIERAGTFDAMVRGKQLLAADRGCGAQQIMSDQLHDMAADSAGLTTPHDGVRIA
jgi:hypothetical protein